jgi:hypothetical protein
MENQRSTLGSLEEKQLKNFKQGWLLRKHTPQSFFLILNIRCAAAWHKSW